MLLDDAAGFRVENDRRVPACGRRSTHQRGHDGRSRRKPRGAHPRGTPPLRKALHAISPYVLRVREKVNPPQIKKVWIPCLRFRSYLPPSSISGWVASRVSLVLSFVL